MLLKLFLSTPLHLWTLPPLSLSHQKRRSWPVLLTTSFLRPAHTVNGIVSSWNDSQHVKSFQNDFTEISCFLLYRCFCGLEPQPRQTLWMGPRPPCPLMDWSSQGVTVPRLSWHLCFDNARPLLPLSSPFPGAVGLLWVVFLINLICSLVFLGLQMPECWIYLSLVFLLAAVETHFFPLLFTLTLFGGL